MFGKLTISIISLLILAYEWWVRKPTVRFNQQSYPKGNKIRIAIYWLVAMLVLVILITPSSSTQILFSPFNRLPEQIIIFVEVIGWILFGLGWILAILGRRYLDLLWRPGNTGNFELENENTLIMNGPYKLIRHPIYVGEILLLLGLFCIFQIFILVIVFFDRLVLILVRTKYEEEYLAKKFGDQWISYCKRVPKFIPWIPK